MQTAARTQSQAFVVSLKGWEYDELTHTVRELSRLSLLGQASESESARQERERLEGRYKALIDHLGLAAMSGGGRLSVVRGGFRSAAEMAV